MKFHPLLALAAVARILLLAAGLIYAVAAFLIATTDWAPSDDAVAFAAIMSFAFISLEAARTFGK